MACYLQRMTPCGQWLLRCVQLRAHKPHSHDPHTLHSHENVKENLFLGLCLTLVRVNSYIVHWSSWAFCPEVEIRLYCPVNICSFCPEPFLPPPPPFSVSRKAPAWPKLSVSASDVEKQPLHMVQHNFHCSWYSMLYVFGTDQGAFCV